MYQLGNVLGTCNAKEEVRTRLSGTYQIFGSCEGLVEVTAGSAFFQHVITSKKN